MESIEARNLLIEFAQAYESAQLKELDQKERVIATLLESTRNLLRCLIGREPTEDEIADVLPY